MTFVDLHPEDIKAQLRKRHGTVGRFATARGFKPQAVADWLRGRTSAAVERAVAEELGLAEPHQSDTESMNVDDSDNGTNVHRLNVEAR